MSKILIFAVAILLCMAFAVNIGMTFAVVDYTKTVGDKITQESSTYLNDVVINNSTSLVPIPYPTSRNGTDSYYGTINREISFDYGFSEAMDIAITYRITNTDNSPVKGVALNIVDRDEYILDVANVIQGSNVNYFYNTGLAEGTLYYMGTLQGQGTKTVFSGVTFDTLTYLNENANKKLQIEINVYKKLAVTDATKTTYYTASHYFSRYKISTSDSAFDKWIAFKKGTVASNILMSYNSRCNYDLGMPFCYDSTVTNRTASINSAYIYNINSPYARAAYAGGNKYEDGLGIYYIAKTSGSIRFRLGFQWYNSSNVAQSLAISNVTVTSSPSFSIINDMFCYNYTISAGEYGYIDLLKNIEITTIIDALDLSNYVNCRLVVHTVTASFIETANISGGWSPSGTESHAVEVLDSTSANPYLFKSATNAGSVTMDLNVSVKNNSDSAIKINSLQFEPKFYTYTGNTGSLTIAKTIYLDQTTSNLIYDTSVWTLGAVNNHVYTISTKTGFTIAPHTSLTVISGAYVNNDNAQSIWRFLGDDNITYYTGDYWFVADVDTITYTANTEIISVGTSYSGLELITELDEGAINTSTLVDSYIGVRNNTNQLITSVTLRARFANKIDVYSAVSFNVFKYQDNSTVTGNNTADITFVLSGINLRPHESALICKISLSSATNFGLQDFSFYGATGARPDNTVMYLKRDMASGNVSVINPTSSSGDSTLGLTLATPSGAIVDPALLNGGTDKWTYENSKFRYYATGRSEYLLRVREQNTYFAKVRQGQLLNIFTDYTTSNVTGTISA